MGSEHCAAVWSIRVPSPDKVCEQRTRPKQKKNGKSTRRAEVSPTAAAAVNRRFQLDAQRNRRNGAAVQAAHGSSVAGAFRAGDLVLELVLADRLVTSWKVESILTHLS